MLGSLSRILPVQGLTQALLPVLVVFLPHLSSHLACNGVLWSQLLRCDILGVWS